MTQHSDEQPTGPWWRPAVSPPPSWIWLLGIAADAGTGVWQLITTNGTRDAGLFLGSMVWPGAAITAAVFVVVWLGWSLDLE
ncbi:MAG TPA: hypothetical protein VIO16_01240 [Dehalococcoidia bacterium]|jgi:hypothetical protein